MLTACILSLMFSIGVFRADAAGSPRVMAFVTHDVLGTWVPTASQGEKTNASTIGAQAILTARFYNRTAQFGKPRGTAVGRLLLDCTVLNVPTDGNCTGIVHVPDGFFLIGGNGPFVPSPRHYAITGGIGPYATAHGQVTITTSATGASVIDVVVAQ